MTKHGLHPVARRIALNASRISTATDPAKLARDLVKLGYTARMQRMLAAPDAGAVATLWLIAQRQASKPRRPATKLVKLPDWVSKSHPASQGAGPSRWPTNYGPHNVYWRPPFSRAAANMMRNAARRALKQLEAEVGQRADAKEIRAWLTPVRAALLWHSRSPLCLGVLATSEVFSHAYGESTKHLELVFNDAIPHDLGVPARTLYNTLAWLHVHNRLAKQLIDAEDNVVHYARTLGTPHAAEHAQELMASAVDKVRRLRKQFPEFYP